MDKVTCEEEDWCKNKADYRVGGKPICFNHLGKAIRKVRQTTSIVNGGIGDVAVSPI